MEIEQISKILAKQIDSDITKQSYAKAGEILKLVGAGLFLASSLVVPNLPRMLAPLFQGGEKEAWKRFNVPYIKRTIDRLEKQKLIEIFQKDGEEMIKVTELGKIKILKMSLDKLTLEKPNDWDGKWWIVSYDLPRFLKSKRNIFREYLKVWRFYPLQESVFIHAYPCKPQIDFLREYLGIAKYVRTIKASGIENDTIFREFFGV